MAKANRSPGFGLGLVGLLVLLAGCSTGSRPAGEQRLQPIIPANQRQPLKVILSLATRTVETDSFKRHHRERDCSDTYASEDRLRTLLEREAQQISWSFVWIEAAGTREDMLDLARQMGARYLILIQRELTMDMKPTRNALLCRVLGTGHIEAFNAASGQSIQSTAVTSDQIEAHRGETQAFTSLARQLFLRLAGASDGQ